jgi:hypothetical protein
MKLKSLVLAAALLPAFAFADTYTVDLTAGTNGLFSGGLNATHQVGSFTDTWTFNYAATSGKAQGFFTNLTNLFTNSDIDFTSVTLNGNAVTPVNSPWFSSAQFAGVDVTGPVTLVINGTVNGNVASYGGTIDVAAPVPEPATYGMLIGGMGVLGFLARRRKQQ